MENVKFTKAQQNYLLDLWDKWVYNSLTSRDSINKSFTRILMDLEVVESIEEYCQRLENNVEGE